MTVNPNTINFIGAPPTSPPVASTPTSPLSSNPSSVDIANSVGVPKINFQSGIADSIPVPSPQPKMSPQGDLLDKAAEWGILGPAEVLTAGVGGGAASGIGDLAALYAHHVLGQTPEQALGLRQHIINAAAPYLAPETEAGKTELNIVQGLTAPIALATQAGGQVVSNMTGNPVVGQTAEDIGNAVVGKYAAKGAGALAGTVIEKPLASIKTLGEGIGVSTYGPLALLFDKVLGEPANTFWTTLKQKYQNILPNSSVVSGVGKLPFTKEITNSPSAPPTQENRPTNTESQETEFFAPGL